MRTKPFVPEGLEQELNSVVQVIIIYRDDDGRPCVASCIPACQDDGVRIELRPHLVVTRSVLDSSSEDGMRQEETDIPLERVLMVDLLDSDRDQGLYSAVRLAQGPSGVLQRLTA